MKKIISLLVILILLLTGCNPVVHTQQPTPTSSSENLKQVASMSQLKTLLEANKDNLVSRWYRGITAPTMYKNSEDAESSVESVQGSSDYSQTNTQVSGVDEADTVKTDGSYIYQINDFGKVHIVSVDSDGQLNLVNQIIDFDEDFHPRELYVDDSFLIVIGSSYNNDGSYTTAYVYDKTDIANLSLLKNIMIKGYYVSSRKIDTSLYLISNYSPYYYYLKDTDLLPCYIEDGVITYQTPNEIYYFDDVDYSTYLILGGIDLSDLSKDVNLNTYLGSGQTIYMSHENLYVTYPTYQYSRKIGILSETSSDYKQTSVIHKFSAESAVLNYVATAEVEGYPINQFAMDEHNGFFRIAVTATKDGESVNNVHIFDSELIQTGAISNMAPGERIYSVRFNGDIGYMVTFVSVDPLFVMDLSDPYNPKVDGELKIPGYSTYMHMYSDTLILGFGMDTDSSEGRVLNQGIKIAMFDVSDRTNPTQLFMTVIGGRGTWSPLNNDHKAFMINRERNIFTFPAQIAGNNYEMKAQGLVVCRIDIENNQFEVLDILSQDYFTNWNNYVQRGLYINNILLTISSNAIYSYNFDSLELIDNVIFD